MHSRALGFGAKDTAYYSQVYILIYNVVLLIVPMDLDVKMKAVMLGACFLIVSTQDNCIVTTLFIFLNFLMYNRILCSLNKNRTIITDVVTDV